MIKNKFIIKSNITLQHLAFYKRIFHKFIKLIIVKKALFGQS